MRHKEGPSASEGQSAQRERGQDVLWQLGKDTGLPIPSVLPHTHDKGGDHVIPKPHSLSAPNVAILSFHSKTQGVWGPRAMSELSCLQACRVVTC